MPASCTPVRHCRQSRPGACLPACVRMVLAAWGDTRTEAQLAAVFDSYEFGTPASRIKRLAKLSYHVEFGPSTLDELQVHLEDGLFPIVFVRADLLPWADFGGLHALVLTEMTSTDVALLDPALADGPSRLSKDGFLLAWEEFDYLAAVISR